MKRKSIKRVIGAVLTTSLLVSMLGVTTLQSLQMTKKQ